MVSPTLEQQAIVNAVASGKTLKVSALAGTGKTSTLVMIAKAYPNKKGLYLAYNKALQLEAQQRFPAWVECKTIHGLAFCQYGWKFTDQLKERADPSKLIAQLDIEEYHVKLPGEELVTFSTLAILGLTKEVVSHFSFSNKATIELNDIEWYIVSETSKSHSILAKKGEIYDKNKSLIDDFYLAFNNNLLGYARTLWRLQANKSNNNVPAEHDTYLKLYQLSQPKITEYDYIMLDEAQDANPCILDILQKQICQIIYVGDQHQQIYAYRGTVNAMEKIDADTYYLTQSFRFGDAIADEANVILKDLDSPFQVKGLSSINSCLGFESGSYTFIARTNAKLIETCVDRIGEGYKCCFAGDIKSVLSLIRSAYSLWCKKPEWVRDQRVTSFLTWDELVIFAKDQDDAELLMPINFILKHGKDTLTKLKVVESEAKHTEQDADIIFTTAHKSKGREWDQVALANDFNLRSDQEKNLYYVAMTRAKFALQHNFPNMP